LTKPLYFYNGTTFELVGPTTPQSPIAYQTSAPTAPATGDLWIDSDGDVDTYNRQLTRYYYVATAAQTTITGVDANGLTLAYVAGSEAVYVNGALQVRGQDYTATDGTSVVMSSGLAVNDVVEIFAYTAFTVANAYTKAESDSLRIGSILQVVSTTKTDTFTSAVGSTWTDITGLSVNITPKSSVNKILVTLSISGNGYRSGLNGIFFRLVRNSTAISIGDAAGSRQQTTFPMAQIGTNMLSNSSCNYLDSPATTSSTTYKIQFWQDTPGSPLFINRGTDDGNGTNQERSTSTITVMEVAV
jgi:hypothetical protein